MRDSTLKYKEQYDKRMENYNSRGMKEEPKPKGLVDRMKGKEEGEPYTVENALQEVFDMIKDSNNRLLEERKR